MRALRCVILVLSVVCAGCGSTGDIIRKDYVEADRATYDAIASEYTNYVTNDQSLDSDEKKRRERTVTTWRMRLEQAEKPVTINGNDTSGGD